MSTERGKPPRPFMRMAALVAFSGMAAPACAADRQLETSERMSKSQQAVGFGTTDDANEFPYSAALRFPGTNTAICSSFLASRRYLVTAAHCAKNPLNLADVDAVFATQKAIVDPPDGRVISHTKLASGPIARHIPSVSSDSNVDIARDVAVIRLSTEAPRVPRPLLVRRNRESTLGARDMRALAFGPAHE
jgi:hypothetical protein